MNCLLTEIACFSFIAGSFALPHDCLLASGGLYKLFSLRCPVKMNVDNQKMSFARNVMVN